MQARYGGNDAFSPSVAQTMEVTTTYELIIPDEINREEDTAQISVSENISLENREVRIRITEIGAEKQNDGSVDDESGQMMVISSSTPDKKKSFSLAEFFETSEKEEDKPLRLLFNARMVEN